MSPNKSLQTPKKQHRKVKTGCRTCRARRVKCDEGFPACQRCISMGRICDGYGIWGGGGAVCQSTVAQTIAKQRRQTTSALGSLWSTAAVSPTTPYIIPGTSIDPEEQSYLDWFIHESATRTPKVFNSPFWDPVILQATMHEPMILQAILALSSVHKRRVLDPANMVRDVLIPDAQEVFLLKQYSKAIKNMRQHLEQDIYSSRTQLMLAIIMCGIFTQMEYIKGNYEAGQIHMNCGGRLSKALLAYPGDEGKDIKFILFFSRMHDEDVRVQDQEEEEGQQQQDVQDEDNKPVLQVVTPFAMKVQVSPQLRFESHIEAGCHLDAIIEMLSNNIAQAKMIPSSAIKSRELLEGENAYVIASCQAWHWILKATTEEISPTMTQKDCRGWKAVEKKYDVAQKMADTCLVFKSDEDEIVSPSDEVLESFEERKKKLESKARTWKKWLNINADMGLQKQALFEGTHWYS